jgi:2-polyprenyl-6-hydroxyphenyl methylase/3-demethylubiquinone-9 3-methyltransferase
MKNITVNKKELDKFSKLASEWWDPKGKFKPLHKFNPVRLSYIKKTIVKKKKLLNNKKPLKNIRILDIGCGGGLLCEPLAKMGAKVIGIDASEKNIKIAKSHANKSKLKVDYYCATPENFKFNSKFDVVLNMEIVEHVDNVDLFLNKSSKFLKNNGIMIIATLNKTLKSFIFAIVGAEYVLRWLPIGTHDWNMFVKPDELIKICKQNSLVLDETFGVKYNIISNEWSLSSDDDVNYMARFKKI